MNNEREHVKAAAKEVVGNKSSKDCTIEERIEVSRKMGGLGRRKNETRKEQMDRINAFRCGW